MAFQIEFLQHTKTAAKLTIPHLPHTYVITVKKGQNCPYFK
jgi:hypothetical protein